MENEVISIVLSEKEKKDRQDGNKWRFTGNNFHEESGLDTTDMEMFRKDPVASLAREVCQNSIDAKKDGETKVEVVFDIFKVKRETIPNIQRVEEEIISCIKYQKSKNIEKNVESLEHMLSEIRKPEITCLRISDYNTRGLTQIDKYSDGEGTFYNLTRISGNSDKSAGSGGSKGVGKYATFVVSNFNTVFYSTMNENNQVGFLGVSKLCSAIYNGKERTDGTGYYGKNYQGEPIFGSQLELTAEYKRETTGTDIYVLGFNDSGNWKSDILIKVLDSFMTALLREELVVKIGEIVLSKDNLEYLISNIDKYTSRAKEIKNIKSQYFLQTDDSIKPVIIDMGVYGDATLYVKAHSKEESEYATQECIMVRYPYMKIKSLKNIAHIPFSALCVIGDNKLNENLRSIENPQHDSWDIHELDKKPIKQKEVKTLYTDFIDKITDTIQDLLSVTANSESDIEGAGEFLPANAGDMGNNKDSEKSIIDDEVSIVRPKKNKIKETIVNQENEDGEGLTPNFIDRSEDGEGSPIPTGSNFGGGNGPHDGSGESGYVLGGEQEGMTLEKLSGIQYRMIGLDRNTGKYLIVFESPQNASNCKLAFKIVDDNNNKEKVFISEALINGQPAIIENGEVTKFDIVPNTKYKIEIVTGTDELYCGEVSIEYESR